MNPLLARRYAGQSPYEEVWYGEVSPGPGYGLWFRYTISDGAHRDCATWAIAFTPDGVRAGRTTLPLDALSLDPDAIFRADGHHLTEDRATGVAGTLRWDLALRDGGRRHDHIPRLLRSLGVLSRVYEPAILDLRCSGTVRVGDIAMGLQDARGMMGHLYGGRNIAEAWGWAHSNSFEEDADALFDGLSVKLKLAGRTLPFLTTLVLFAGGRSYRFSGFRDFARTTADLGAETWRFRARRGAVELEGEATLPEPRMVARLQYREAGGEPLWCRNSKAGRLKLRLVDPEHGVDRELTSRTAAFELLDRVPIPPDALTLPDPAG